MKDATLIKVPRAHKLIVATETQADNQGGEGWRECFSSSCAAIARYHGRIGSDDAYNRIRRRYGDTTNHAAHVKALAFLGLSARFTATMNLAKLREEIYLGNPVAVGWLHQGKVSAPGGGGHWSVVTGYDEKSVFMMDPNGEADLINGGYVSTGRGWQGPYSCHNWCRRWELQQIAGGYRYAPGNGWAITVRKNESRSADAVAA